MPQGVPDCCRNCRSAMVLTEIDGACRRFPPQIFSNSTSGWPVVHLDHGYCDEHKRGKQRLKPEMPPEAKQ